MPCFLFESCQNLYTTNENQGISNHTVSLQFGPFLTPHRRTGNQCKILPNHTDNEQKYMKIEKREKEVPHDPVEWSHSILLNTVLLLYIYILLIFLHLAGLEPGTHSI